MDKNIVLVGFMGSGKTTVGRRVAARLGIDFYDTDEAVKKCENMPVADVVAKKGQKYFEGAQRFAVADLCENRGCLISTGGGTMADEYNRKLLKENGILVWLRASAETIYENTCRSHNKRPEISGKSVEEIAELLAEREPFYAESDIVVDVNERDMDKIIETVLKELKKYM